MLQRKRGHAPPSQGGDMPRSGKKRTAWSPRVDADQYSLGSSSVVTLRSPSVMIQSVRSGVTR
jgi:hypothetical protein